VLKALLWLLRVYAYVFHLLLALLLLGMGFIALISHKDLTLGMLPWQGATVVPAVLALGAVGFVCVVLAVTGAARWLFPLWTLFALVMMFRGFFMSSYAFTSAAEFRYAAWGTLGALVAFLASLSLWSRRRG
jgi:hypothetical protein